MSIIIAIIIFSALILFHELGHFLVAKKNHIHVYEFSLGLGPTICGITKGETKYCLKLLPFGGSCVMGEDDETDPNDAGAFNNKSVWARMAVVAAGPIFNFILAFVLAAVVIGMIGYDEPIADVVIDGSPAFEAGLTPGDHILKVNGKRVRLSREITLIQSLNPEEELDITFTHTEEDGSVTQKEGTIVPYLRNVYQVGIYMNTTAPEITGFTEGSAAEEAGVLVGDVIVSVNGTPVSKTEEVSENIQKCGGKPVTMGVRRDGETLELEMEPEKVSGYYSGLEMNNSLRTRGNPLRVVQYSFYELKYWIQTTFKTLGMLVTGQVGFNDLSGPVGIVDTIGTTYEQSRESGAKYVWVNMLNMAILLSANLGVMNLLPIPALDGGRLVFFIIEAIRGKRISPEKEGMVHFIGFILLMLLMAAVLFNDVRKLFFR